MMGTSRDVLETRRCEEEGHGMMQDEGDERGKGQKERSTSPG